MGTRKEKRRAKESREDKTLPSLADLTPVANKTRASDFSADPDLAACDRVHRLLSEYADSMDESGEEKLAKKVRKAAGVVMDFRCELRDELGHE